MVEAESVVRQLKVSTVTTTASCRWTTHTTAIRSTRLPWTATRLSGLPQPQTGMPRKARVRHQRRWKSQPHVLQVRSPSGFWLLFCAEDCGNAWRAAAGGFAGVALTDGRKEEAFYFFGKDGREVVDSEADTTRGPIDCSCISNLANHSRHMVWMYA